MMLYTINYASLNSNNLDSLIQVCPEGAPILFYEDGVYACKEHTALSEKIQKITESHPTFVLEEDVEARGIKSLVAGVKPVSYDGFVGLVESHNVVPWLRN